MSDHDPLCPFSDTFGAPCMYCALITRVRADERAQYQGRRDDMMRALSEELLNVRTKTLADLRAEVQVMKDEAGQALLHAETTDEVTAASVGISVLDDVLDLFDGGVNPPDPIFGHDHGQ